MRLLIFRRVVTGVFFCLLFICTARPVSAGVLPGIDVLIARDFDILQGKRIGLITNHTGRTAAGVSTIDVLFHAPSLQLVALFSPEHGIRGTADEKLGPGADPATGLVVHSLYGATCRPTPEMLHGVEVLVFDIQDIGARFYTYIGTLSLAMAAAREADIPFVVLDRPNPIGGVRIEGAIPAEPLQPLLRKSSGARATAGSAPSGCRELTSIHPIPTRHGMTVGELARLFNVEFGINCDLTVVPMSGWQRSMYYDQTGLAWIDPSPNMRNLDAAILYPGLGILESTNLSVGRGAAHPFQMFGAPWVDGAAVARNLGARHIPGISFTPCRFMPASGSHPYGGRRCSGVCVTVIDRERLDPIQAGLHLVQAFSETQPERFTSQGGFAVEVGDKDVWELLTRKGKQPEEVSGRWKQMDKHFREIREQYLLY